MEASEDNEDQARVGDNCCYLCNQCSSSFASLEELESHMASHLIGGVGEEEGRRAGDENSPSSSDTSFPLDDMGMMKEEEGLMVEMDDEDETEGPKASGPNFPCRFCSKLFTSRSLLNIHYTHTHRDKPQYECEDCGRIFSVKRELATHRRIHSGETTHACAQCGKEFGTRQLLKKHWMWHTGQRAHVCPHCGKAFFQKGHLTQHLMIHAGGRPHVCQLCSKTFIFKFDLNRHMKIHAERGYSCNKCGNAFLKEALLIDHQAKCTAEPMASPHPSTRSPATPRSRAPSVPSTPERKQSISSNGPLSLFPPTSLNLPSDLSNGPASQPGQAQRFVCILCMQDFPSQSAYTLHISYVHLRDAMFNSFQAQTGHQPPSTIFPKTSDPAAFFSALSSLGHAQQLPQQHRRASDSAALLSPPVSQSFQPPLPFTGISNGHHSPSSSKSGETGAVNSRNEGSSSSEELPRKTEPEEEEEEETVEKEMEDELTSRLVHGCVGCDFAQSRLRESDERSRRLEAEVARMKDKMRQVGAIAASLLESCSDFDKLWIHHSKKVYSQIQSVLNSLD